ncbi:GntR family transcriptional regulator [Longispora urticae]
MTRVPKYLSIKEDLIRRIATGEFRVGEPLPSQRDLSVQYDVSLMTLRQAFGELAAQDVIEQVAGKGTFVRSHRTPYAAAGLRSLGDDLRAQGITVDTRVHGVYFTPAPADVATRLRVAVDAPVLVIERVRVINGHPAVHQYSYVPEPFATPLADADLAVRSLYELLELWCHAVAARATEVITPVAVSGRVAELLELAPGDLALRSDRLTYDQAGRVIVDDRAVLAGDRVMVTVDRASVGSAPDVVVTAAMT